MQFISLYILELAQFHRTNSHFQEFENAYLSDSPSRFAQLWNDHRRQILSSALKEHLLPALEREARSLLALEARLRLQERLTEAFFREVNVAPYVSKSDRQVKFLVACL